MVVQIEEIMPSHELEAQAAVLLSSRRITPVSNVTRIMNVITRIILISFPGGDYGFKPPCRNGDKHELNSQNRCSQML